MAIFRSGQEVMASIWTESYYEGLSFAVFLAQAPRCSTRRWALR